MAAVGNMAQIGGQMATAKIKGGWTSKGTPIGDTEKAYGSWEEKKAAEGL
jgi:hypothetical protein